MNWKKLIGVAAAPLLACSLSSAQHRGGPVDISWDFTVDCKLTRIDWPASLTDAYAMVRRDNVASVSIIAASGVRLRGAAHRLFVVRGKKDVVFSISVQGSNCSLDEAVHEASGLLNLLKAPSDDLTKWHEKTRQGSPGAGVAFGGSYVVQPDSYNVSILKSYENDAPWFVQIEMFPFARPEK